MVKPALAYGDLIRAVQRCTGLPVAAYNVSGEYAMVKAAAAAGHLDERATVLEILTSLRRAGADVIITYHAKDAARWLTSRVDHRRYAHERRSRPHRFSDRASGAGERRVPKTRSRTRWRGGRARRARPPAAQPDAGQLPARAPALRGGGAGGGDPRGAGAGSACGGCWRSGSSARSPRSTTRARSATPRCWWRPRSTPSTRGGRRRSSTPTRGSRTTTCATTTSTCGSRSPPSPTRGSAWRARWRSCSELTGAESIRQLPTLKLFKIRMDLEMEGDTKALASEGVGAARRWCWRRSPTTSSTSP